MLTARRYCVSSFAAVLLISTVGLTVQSQEKPEHQRLGRGDLATTLEIFNLWGEQPTEKQEIVKMAYVFLQSRPRGTIAELAEQPEFQRLCREAGLTHLGGPMLGCLTSDGLTVWLRTLGPAQVSVEIPVDGEPRRFGPVASTRETDFTAVVPIKGLPPGRVLPYRVLIDGKAAQIPENAVIRTLPEDSRKLRIAFGSCMHRWGLGNAQLITQIRSRQPAVLLLIGDTAAQDRDNHLGLHRLDYLVRDLTPAWQQLVAEIPVYVTWDDHDYFTHTEQISSVICS